MKSQGKQLFVVIICADLLILIGILIIRSVGSHGPNNNAALNTTTPETAPGIVISGSVRASNGAGVENVAIYMSYASYPGKLIATTDAAGIYKSEFYAIPGDEMITVWAEWAGLQFQPKNYNWRHYYGYETRACDFLASPVMNIYIPLLTRAVK